MGTPLVASDLSWVADPVRPRPAVGARVARLLDDLAHPDGADEARRAELVDGFWGGVARLGAPLGARRGRARLPHPHVPVPRAPGDPARPAVQQPPRRPRPPRRRPAAPHPRHRHLAPRFPAAGRSPRRLPDRRRRLGGPPTDPDRLQRFLRTLQRYAGPDPLNPRTIPTRWGGPDCSVFALPDAPARRWEGRTRQVPRGGVERHRLDSPALGAERDVWVYLPPGPGHRDLPVVVPGDGGMWFGGDGTGLADSLDRLIADGTLPPLIVLAPDSVDNATRWREMGARDPYVTFLADDLLPWAAGRWPLTTDPRRTVVAGQSLGGLTALYAGLVRAERFGNVLAQSPSLWWHPDLRPATACRRPPVVGVPWLVRCYAEAAPRDLTVHMDVGPHEGPTVGYCRALHETLRPAGRRVTLEEFNGGHDYACWHGALVDALVRMLASWSRVRS